MKYFNYSSNQEMQATKFTESRKNSGENVVCVT